MLCRKCGVDVPHVCAPEQLVGRAVVDCPIKKGAIWVQVTGQGGAGLPGVSVKVGGTLPTDPTGFVGFDPLDERDDYVVELTAISDLLEPSYGLPNPATSPAPVKAGEITFLSFALLPRIKPVLTLSKTVVGVGGARITAKLEAVPVADGACPFPGKGTGTLTVAKGAASVKVYRENVEVVLDANELAIDSVPADGITLELEAVDASAFEGIELEWKLASDTLPVVAAADKKVATAAKAELVAKTKRGTVLSADVKHGVGGVVHLQNPGGTRARLEVTPRCLPAELVGKLQVAVIKGNIAVYDADTAGNLVDLRIPIDVGPRVVVAPLYVQGTTVSDPDPADTGLTLALVDVIDRADVLKLTVVETSLDVYGGTPGPSDPAVLLTDEAKLDPGRRLYVQETTKWWWGRAKVKLTKKPPLAPCKLSLRQAGGAGTIRLFPATGTNPQAQQVSLETHLEGETAVVLPLELAVDAIPDPVAGVVYWAEGVTSSGADKRGLFVDIVDVEDGCDQVAFRVLPPLDEFQRIVLVDLGGPGTGHQAAVVKLIASLAAIGFAGDVVLAYNRKKTRIYGNALGKGGDLADPVRSYALYFNEEWTGLYPPNAGPGRNRLTIRCRPIGVLDLTLTPAQTRMFTDVQTFWTQYAWPSANPPAFAGPKPVQAYGPAAANWAEQSKWTRSNDAPTLWDDGTTITRLLYEQRKWRQAKVYDQETGASMASDAELLELAPVVARTLTAFGAMDFHAASDIEASAPDFKTAYFDHHWLPVMRRMTREDHPVAMSFQPFLWTGGHPMQVRQDTIIDPPVDVVTKVVAAGGKPVYRLVPADPAGDDNVIAALPDVPKTVLQNAKAGLVYLVSAYYGEPVSDINYVDLCRVMVRVIKAVAPNKPVVVALIGDDRKDAHTLVANEVEAVAQDGAVIARLNAAVSGLQVSIELAHIGRTTAMTQFQRYSKLFVTEGANTWQEVLTMGTPSLSVKPSGNTKPWEENPPAGAGVVRTTVKEASEALIDAGQDAGNAGAHAKLEAYLTAALDSNSDVSNYFKDWKRLLADPHSDQVVTAVNYLPDPADL
jgi:hypothetical protein